MKTLKALPRLVFTISLTFLLTSANTIAAADDGDNDVLKSQADEDVLLQTEADILNGTLDITTQKEANLNTDMVLQAIDDITYKATPATLQNALAALEQLEEKKLDLATRMQAEAIRRTILKKDVIGDLKDTRSDNLKMAYFFKALFQQLDKKSALVLLSNTDLFSEASWKPLIAWTKTRYSAWAKLVESEKQTDPMKTADATSSMIKDIFNFEPATDVYASGRYYKKPRVYMFCRSLRQYPCLMVMRDAQGKVWHNPSGQIWSQPALGYSRHLKPYNKPNGDSPAGIQRIDGVMPSADQKLVFGKFRRLILNFVGASKDESLTKLLLPPSSHNDNWWQEASVARDIGRSAFRIHGTGLSSSSSKPYYPLVPTSGCIAKRENKHGGVRYTDQREFLDELMKASGLTVKPENEEALRALVYLIEIDAKKAPVAMTDLQALGLFN